MNETNEEQIEQLFDALMDEPSFYEFEKAGKKVKIPIYSLGLSAFKLVAKMETGDLPPAILRKIKLQQDLTPEETELINKKTTEQLNKIDETSPSLQLVLQTLKLTFPNKSDTELMRIGHQHFSGLIAIILKTNNLVKKKKEGEGVDFQKSQPEQSR